MTTIDTHPDAAGAASDSINGVGAAIVAVAEWVTTTDHKRIGRLFVGWSLLASLVVGVLGVVFGIERADDGVINFDADALLQLAQGFRAGLVFAVIAPLTIGIAVAVAPLQVGARTMAFPRVALTGFYAWLGGVVVTFIALIANGGIGGGDADMVDLYLAGHGLMILGLLAAAGTLATTVLTTRAPGMTMRRVPLFAWSALVGAIGALAMLPVAFGTIIYLFVDHRIGDQLNFGGSEGIAAWLGWVWSTPAVLVFTLPAIGVFAELVPVTFRGRQAMRGSAFAGIALVGVLALGAATQQVSMAVSLDTNQDTGDFIADLIPFLIFNGLPVLGLLIAGGAGMLTVRQSVRSRPNLRAPFVFALFGLLVIGAAIVGNLLLAITNLDLLGTVFEEGVVVLGVYGTVIAVMGGLIYWAPKLSGRVIGDAKAVPIALLAALGAVLAGGSMLVAGALGQVGWIPNSDLAIAAMLDLSDSAPIWNVLSLAGHGVMVVAVLGFIGLLVSTRVPDDEAVDENPYGGHTIEWSTTSPAPAHNFAHLPTVSSAEPVFDLTAEGMES